jgi:predicted dehydrogenase
MQELRYNAAFVTGWHCVQKGTIGQPLLLTAQKSYPLGKRPDFYRKRETYGGTIPWVGSHAVDLIYWFAGADFHTVYAAQSTMANQGIGTMEIFATMQFKMSNGSLAVSYLDYLRSPKAGSWGDDRIRVMGEHGSVEVKDDTVTLHQPDQPPAQIPIEPRRLIFGEFLRLIATGEKMLLTPEECLRSTEVSLIARQSADEDRIIEIPPA